MNTTSKYLSHIIFLVQIVIATMSVSGLDVKGLIVPEVFRKKSYCKFLVCGIRYVKRNYCVEDLVSQKESETRI